MEYNYLDLIPDALLERIMFQMDGETIINFCNDYKRAQPLCTESFWKKKYALEFPDETMPQGLIGANVADIFVNRYYSSPEDKWNVTKATNAAKGYYFINAMNGARMSPNGMRHRLTQSLPDPQGLPTVELKPIVIYHTGYRITGTPEDVAHVLKDAGINQKTINEILITAITPQNMDQEPYKSMIDNEIIEYNKLMENKRATRWNPRKANKLLQQQRGQFIQAKTGLIGNISQASRIWTRNPDYSYHVGYRIYGSTEDITIALKDAGIEDATIAQILITSIDGNNYTQEPFATEYRQELTNYINYYQLP